MAWRLYSRAAGFLTGLMLLGIVLGCGRTTPGSARPGSKEEGVPAAQKLVGTWKFAGNELGRDVKVIWHVRPDGTATYILPGDIRQNGHWQYSEGILYEKYQNGAEGRCRVEGMDVNQFDLTILDNGIPAYAGLHRHYTRQ